MSQLKRTFVEITDTEVVLLESAIQEISTKRVRVETEDGTVLTRPVVGSLDEDEEQKSATTTTTTTAQTVGKWKCPCKPEQEGGCPLQASFDMYQVKTRSTEVSVEVEGIGLVLWLPMYPLVTCSSFFEAKFKDANANHVLFPSDTNPHALILCLRPMCETDAQIINFPSMASPDVNTLYARCRLMKFLFADNLLIRLIDFLKTLKIGNAVNGVLVTQSDWAGMIRLGVELQDASLIDHAVYQFQRGGVSSKDILSLSHIESQILNLWRNGDLSEHGRLEAIETILAHHASLQQQ
jgi:hypothetical protein